MKEPLVIGSDHGGFALKEALKRYLVAQGHEVEDVGTRSEVSVDYPLYARRVTDAILSGKVKRGILICGTGLGMCYAANRRKGIRAALCTSVEMARLASAHNNANILCLGGRTTTEADAFAMVQMWLDTPFEGGRHEKRIRMLDD